MAESLSRLSSIFETAKEFTIDAVARNDLQVLRPHEISRLLNSRVEKDVLNGMKSVISMMARDEDVVPFFADIVKNITSSDSSIRDLVLLYVAKYAEIEPDTALLSINSIQKLLGHKEPITRANSIRSMSSIQIASIEPVVVLCIKRTVIDTSYLVRMATAMAISKISSNLSNHEQLMDYLAKLLADNEPQVVGSAIKAFIEILNETGQTNWQFIHGHFRRLCTLIKDFDEWSQIAVIELLTDYCRLFLPKPNEVSNDLDYAMDPDLQLFVNNLKPLVFRDSPGLLLAVIRALIGLELPEKFNEFEIPGVLCSMINDTRTPVLLFSLHLIYFICQSNNQGFMGHIGRFFVFPSDNLSTVKLKLSILSSLVNESNIKPILAELQYIALNYKESVAVEAIKAVGRCCYVSEKWNGTILKWCLRNIKNTQGQILNELLTIIRFLLQIQQGLEQEVAKIVYNLSLILHGNTVLEPEARASIIWIIGEFTKQCHNKISPDVLRILLKNFSNEAEQVRYQILLLGAKLYSVCLDEYLEIHKDIGDFNQQVIPKMFLYGLRLSQADQSYDIRDTARMLNFLLNSNSDTSKLASLFLQVPKHAPAITSALLTTQTKLLRKYMKFPDWGKDLPDPGIRNALGVQINKVTDSISFMADNIKETEISNRSAEGSKHSKLLSLDEFFGEEDTDSDSDSSSGSVSESELEEDVDAEDADSVDADSVDAGLANVKISAHN